MTNFLTLVILIQPKIDNNKTFLVADTAAGCELIAKFFCLDENHQIIGPLLQGTILQESAEGRELYHLYKYAETSVLWH